MKCFKCHKNMSECKSQFGFYYSCPKCERTFETGGQQKYNSKIYCSRLDYEKNEIVYSQNTDLSKTNDKNQNVK